MQIEQNMPPGLVSFLSAVEEWLGEMAIEPGDFTVSQIDFSGKDGEKLGYYWWDAEDGWVLTIMAEN